MSRWHRREELQGSVAAFCAKAGCPLHAFSLDWGDPRWCTIGADAAADAQAQKSYAHWFSVDIDKNGILATLLYDYQSAHLVFVLGQAQDGRDVCLAGRVPPEAQCQGFRYTGVGLCAP